MAATEAGHHAGRSFMDRDGAFHLNSAAFYNSDGNDIADQLDVLDTLVAAEMAFLDGAIAGTVVASKALVVDANRDIATLADITSDGTLTLSGSTTQHISITGAATSAQIKISGSAILASGEQAIYINCAAETVATNGIWITLKSDVITGDCSGVRSRVTGNAASGGANIRGAYCEAFCGASLNAAVMQGVCASANMAAGVCTATIIQALYGIVCTGATFVCPNVYVGYLICQTRGDETISGNDCLLGLENEAVGGNGRKMDSFIRCFGTNLSGVNAADYLIDGGTATTLLTTAFLRLPDDGTVAHDTDETSDVIGALDTDKFIGFIKVIIGTATRYIPLLDNPPSSTT